MTHVGKIPVFILYMNREILEVQLLWSFSIHSKCLFFPVLMECLTDLTASGSLWVGRYDNLLFLLVQASKGLVWTQMPYEAVSPTLFRPDGMSDRPDGEWFTMSWQSVTFIVAWQVSKGLVWSQKPLWGCKSKLIFYMYQLIVIRILGRLPSWYLMP